MASPAATEPTLPCTVTVVTSMVSVSKADVNNRNCSGTASQATLQERRRRTYAEIFYRLPAGAQIRVGQRMEANQQRIFVLFLIQSIWIQCTSTQSLSVGDVFVGQFEYDQGSAGEFEIRIHSAVHGALVISQYGVGPVPGQMTQCDPATGFNCAGGPLENPIFGFLNYTGLGACSQPGCTPQIQPSTGCIAYGCQVQACGCVADRSQGCWGVDLRGAVALIQVKI